LEYGTGTQKYNFYSELKKLNHEWEIEITQ
jgi:hypothetical protein